MNEINLVLQKFPSIKGRIIDTNRCPTLLFI